MKKYAALLIGLLMATACATDPTNEESVEVRDAKISFKGEGAVVTGTVEGELRSVDASQIVVDGKVLSEGELPADVCGICVCSGRVCLCEIWACSESSN